jgi:hypothetical protein
VGLVAGLDGGNGDRHARDGTTAMAPESHRAVGIRAR